MRSRPVFVIGLVLTLAVAAAIFWFSSRDAGQSNAQSEILSDSLAVRILTWFHLSPEQAERVYRFSVKLVRKTAHFAEFAALGFALTLTCLGAGRAIRLSVGASFGAGTLYAITDEIHQIFVEGRACQARDVLIDACGVLTGVGLMLLLWITVDAIIKRERSRNSKKHEI